MILTRCFLLLALLSVSLSAAGPLDDKGPPYFVDRYGLAKSTETVSKHAFFSSGRRGCRRTFQKDKLRVEAVFFSPSLKPAAVNLRMGLAWSEKQIQAALAAYGGEWKPVRLANGIVKEWVAPDGANAICLISSLHIQSKAVVAAVAKELAMDEAKRKAVPTF